MKKIFLVGNPNTGKSTLFNSLTKSNEHTGNWHGVTVDAKSKIIKLENETFEIFDLPGLYSLNAFTMEEKISFDYITKYGDGIILYLIDANSLKRNMFLLMQLLSLGRNVKVCINNYDTFKKAGGEIDNVKLSQILGCECEIVNAEKQKISKKFLNFSTNSYGFNDINISTEAKIVYDKINKICDNVLSIDKQCVYGHNRVDNFLLKNYIFVPLFLLLIFLMLYIVFFLIGPILSNLLSILLNNIVKTPIINLLNNLKSSSWVIRFFDEGIFSAGLTICSFLPQICLLYLFLSILEDSGIISRMAFMLDDVLNKVGLNGKCVYTMLMGFGCNTTATFTSKNMADKNSKIKTALLTPFMSCSAKLPIYVVVATALFGNKNIFIITGLYFLGVIVSIILAYIYEKTIFKSKSNNFLIEFPPLQPPRIKKVCKVSINSAKQFFLKVFGIIFSMSVIIWLLSNVGINFKSINCYDSSILYFISSKIAWIFKPIGLNSPPIICALIVGLVAKELIVSTMLIVNKVSSSALLISSLLLTTSPINFSVATAISFLVFVLLYSPCVSNIAVLYKEIGKKYATYGIVTEFLLAYLIALIIYNILMKQFLTCVITLFSLLIVIISIIYIIKKIKHKNLCQGSCINCSRCN